MFALQVSNSGLVRYIRNSPLPCEASATGVAVRGGDGRQCAGQAAGRWAIRGVFGVDEDIRRSQSGAG